MEPLVSIIIPTFNRAHTLERAIQSLKNQTYLNWECLVVDDYSQDNTEGLIISLIVKDTRIRYFKNIRKGSNSARNLGMEKSKGQYVLFLDSDDALEPRMIEISLDLIQKPILSDLAISFTNIYRNDEFKVMSDSVNSENLLLDFLKKSVIWPMNSVLIRKKFLVSNQIHFHPDLLNGQDYCFFLSVISKKPNIVFTQKALSINYHLQGEPKHVKISAGNSIEYKWSRFMSRNLAFGIAIRNLSISQFLLFVPYFFKFQTGLLLDILKAKIS